MCKNVVSANKAIAGDGNCQFSSLYYWITSSVDDQSTVRNMLVKI